MSTLGEHEQTPHGKCDGGRRLGRGREPAAPAHGGTEGRGEKGLDGKDGKEGERGNPRMDGEDGPRGHDGEGGEGGKDGKKSTDGMIERDGDDGKKCDRGDCGDSGADGKDGKEMDAVSGFWAIKMHEDCYGQTVLVGPEGKIWYWKVMAMGMKNFFWVYQRFMDRVIELIPTAKAYMDDVTGRDNTYEDHYCMLEDLMYGFWGVALRLRKCNLFNVKLDMIGHGVKGTSRKLGKRSFRRHRGV